MSRLYQQRPDAMLWNGEAADLIADHFMWDRHSVYWRASSISTEVTFFRDRYNVILFSVKEPINAGELLRQAIAWQVRHRLQA